MVLDRSPAALVCFSGFTFPTGFSGPADSLYNIPVESVSREFTVMQLEENHITVASYCLNTYLIMLREFGYP